MRPATWLRQRRITGRPSISIQLIIKPSSTSPCCWRSRARRRARRCLTTERAGLIDAREGNMRERLNGEPEQTRIVVNDCWNRIGVGGDGSCVELEQHVHCRNCPIYSAAALSLLDRDLPDAYQSDWADHFAQAKPSREADTHSAIIFRIGPEWFAFPTLLFDEIAELRTIHSLPHQRSGAVLGLVNVRGELII